MATYPVQLRTVSTSLAGGKRRHHRKKKGKEERSPTVGKKRGSAITRGSNPNLHERPKEVR